MTQHHHHYRQHGGPEPHGEAGMADLLDLDAEVLGTYLDEATEWVGQHARSVPGTVVDVGAGTGSGTLALAQRFGAADLVAIDASTFMVERLQAMALENGLADRLRAVQADLDVAWPDVGAVDIAWAASSLHHVVDPDRVLRDLQKALNAGGLLVVLELESLPRFLPDNIGLGRPGLEARCHEALAQANWNSHPDWGPQLAQAGYELVEQRTFTAQASRTAPRAGDYAHAYLRRIRSALGDELAADDLEVLDRLLSDDGPDALRRRCDLTVRSSRSAWAARRP